MSLPVGELLLAALPQTAGVVMKVNVKAATRPKPVPRGLPKAVAAEEPWPAVPRTSSSFEVPNVPVAVGVDEVSSTTELQQELTPLPAVLSSVAAEVTPPRCENFVIDVRAAFGLCVCGRPKSAHDVCVKTTMTVSASDRCTNGA